MTQYHADSGTARRYLNLCKALAEKSQTLEDLFIWGYYRYVTGGSIPIHQDPKQVKIRTVLLVQLDADMKAGKQPSDGLLLHFVRVMSTPVEPHPIPLEFYLEDARPPLDRGTYCCGPFIDAAHKAIHRALIGVSLNPEALDATAKLPILGGPAYTDHDVLAGLEGEL